VDALLCRRCSWPLDDGCTCCANTTTRLDVERRHREAVARATGSGWPRTAPKVKPCFPVDPTGRRWIA
jgi:hypothetical protein